MAYGGIGLGKMPTLGGMAGALGSIAGGLTGATLATAGMAGRAMGAGPIMSGVSGAVKGTANLFAGDAGKDGEDGAKGQDSYGGLNLEILNAIYSEVAGIRSILGESDPASEEREKALDADVRHRELLAALYSGEEGVEVEKKKGVLSWLLPGLGGILAALNLDKLVDVIKNIPEYMDSLSTAISNIKEFFTDIDTFFQNMGIDFAGAAILGTIKGMAIGKALTNLARGIKNFGVRMGERFKNWSTKFGEWTDRLNNRWTKIKDGFKTRMTNISNAFDKMRSRVGQWRIEFGERVKGWRTGFAERWKSLKAGFTERMTKIGESFDRLRNRMGQYRTELATRLKGIREGFSQRWTTLKDGFKTRMQGLTDAFEPMKKRMGQYRTQLRVLRTSAMGAIGDGIKSINTKITTSLGDISNRLKGAVSELDLKVKGLTGQLNTHFQSLKTSLTSLLPDSMKPAAKKVRIPTGNYTDPIQKLAKQQLTMKVKAPSGAATTGAASQALTETKPQQVGRSSEFGEKAGDRQESTKGKMPSKVAQWLENHKWIKKLVKPIAKSAAFIGWMMMLYEVYQVTQGWLDTKDKWDMNPMGDDPADLVWQKEMARITAGLSGSLIGGIVGSMVGAMMPLPGTTFLGGLVGGVGGYFAGDALFEASQAEDKPAKTKPKSQYQMKSGDVGGDYAAMAAYGPAYDNITVIQNTVTDASVNATEQVSTNTSVNVGSPLQNRNYSATAVKRESSSPFTRRFNP